MFKHLKDWVMAARKSVDEFLRDLTKLYDRTEQGQPTPEREAQLASMVRRPVTPKRNAVFDRKLKRARKE